MVGAGWWFLAAMVVAYGVANLLQSVGAGRVATHRTLHPGLFVRLAGQWVYLVGVGLQFAGFLLAFLARRELPLFLVQACAAAGLGVTAVLGVLLLRWRLPLAEVVLLVLMAAGVVAQVLAAEPAESHRIGLAGTIVLTVALVAIAALAFPAARLHGAPGSVVLGSLAGMAFAAGAIASRPLASATAHQIATSPLLYLLIAHSVLAQLLLALALQRGSTTAAVAAMDGLSAVPAALVGVLWLGDEIRAGMSWLAAAGFILTILSVLGLTRYAKPQRNIVPGSAGATPGGTAPQRDQQPDDAGHQEPADRTPERPDEPANDPHGGP